MSKKFVKPTIDEIKEYAKEIFPQLDAGRFFDYYESVGWCVGVKRPMKDWKAAIRTWKRNYEERYGKPVFTEDWSKKYRDNT